MSSTASFDIVLDSLDAGCFRDFKMKKRKLSSLMSDGESVVSSESAYSALSGDDNITPNVSRVEMKFYNKDSGQLGFGKKELISLASGIPANVGLSPSNEPSRTSSASGESDGNAASDLDSERYTPSSSDPESSRCSDRQPSRDAEKLTPDIEKVEKDVNIDLKNECSPRIVIHDVPSPTEDHLSPKFGEGQYRFNDPRQGFSVKESGNPAPTSPMLSSAQTYFHNQGVSFQSGTSSFSTSSAVHCVNPAFTLASGATYLSSRSVDNGIYGRSPSHAAPLVNAPLRMPSSAPPNIASTSGVPPRKMPCVSAIPAAALQHNSDQVITYPVLNFPYGQTTSFDEMSHRLPRSDVAGSGYHYKSNQDTAVPEADRDKHALPAPMSNSVQVKVESSHHQGHCYEAQKTSLSDASSQKQSPYTLNWGFLQELQKMQAKQMVTPRDVSSRGQDEGHDDDEDDMICDICADRATGLHYGIVTCEGCKGFFKRTVQNKRVYTCIANGNCEINKAQRNRCQYCRFKKCLQRGMVLAAVREDRMPGGRNAGIVYNMYKIRHRKPKRVRAEYLRAGPTTGGPGRVAPRLLQPGYLQPPTDTWNSSSHSPADQTKSVSAYPHRMENKTWKAETRQKNPFDPMCNKDGDTGSTFVPIGDNTPRSDFGQYSWTVHNPKPRHTSCLPLSAEDGTELRNLERRNDHGLKDKEYGTYGSVSVPSNATEAKEHHAQSQSKSLSEKDIVCLTPARKNTMEVDDFGANLDLDPCNANQMKIIEQLAKCEVPDGIGQYHVPIVDEQSAAAVLCHLGDNIVQELVQWIRKLPFYHEVPLSLHIEILSSRWQQLLLLTTSAHQAWLYNSQNPADRSSDVKKSETFDEYLDSNVRRLHAYLVDVIHQETSLDQLYRELGDMMTSLMEISFEFGSLNISRLEYVCMKVLVLFSADSLKGDHSDVAQKVYCKYRSALSWYIGKSTALKEDSDRLARIENLVPKIASASKMLLDSNMIYIPFLLNTLSTIKKD